MILTDYSSGCEVEHEVCVLLNICQISDRDLIWIQLVMIGGMSLFLIMELKLGNERQDNVMQLFLGLLCKPEFSFLSYAELACSGYQN